MLEFKVIANLKANKDLTDILKKFKYKVKLGQTKTILHTNLQVVILLNTRLHILLLLQYLNTKLMKYQISLFILKSIIKSTILKKLHNFWKSFNFRLYILIICEETYEMYFNISRNLMKGGKLWDVVFM